MRIQRLTKDAKENLLEDLLKRSPNNYGQYEQGVQEILAHVKEEKDQAVFAYTKKFDHADITADNIKVTEEEIEEAYKEVDPKLVEIIRKALLNIRTYHEKQRQYSWFDSKPDGTILGQKVTPLHRVGVYVPGGKAVYPSSVLMNIVPAKVAGVDEIVMVTPPGKDGKVTPNTLVAAHEAGADVIYKVGGAQAIAALAYGTESIPKVDKIVGPGNIYVALAKKAVYGYVSIDAIAGPSEILVIADETANPRFVAADLLSQAEHDELASAILVTTSEELARKVSDEVDGFLKELSRSEIIRKSLKELGECEHENSMDIDRAAGCFGRLMAELFVWKEDIWEKTLRKMGFYLGKFIYLMDAYEDLPEDRKKNRYNPLKELAKRPDYEAQMEQILRMMIAESTVRFEQLPCLVDVDILRNILYDGVWNHYNKIQMKKREDNKDEQKSI